MNKTIILAVQELESKLLTGIISEQFYRKELDRLLEMTNDERSKEYIKLHKDREI